MFKLQRGEKPSKSLDIQHLRASNGQRGKKKRKKKFRKKNTKHKWFPF